MNWLFLFLAAGILFWFIALLYLKSYVKRRTGADYTLENLREEIRFLEADIDAKTEQNLALLEEKIGELRKLCTEAEKRIAVYARELGRKIAEEEAFTALDRSPQEPPVLSAVPPSPASKTPGSNGTPRKAPQKKASPKHSGTAVSSKKVSGGKKTPGHTKETSLLDSIEVREIAAAWAAGAYRAEAQRPGPAVPQGGMKDPAQQSEEEPRPAVESGASPQAAHFTASPNPIKAKAPPMKERVAELYQAGFSEDLVAARLGISITETRLYIAMASGGRS